MDFRRWLMVVVWPLWRDFFKVQARSVPPAVLGVLVRTIHSRAKEAIMNVLALLFNINYNGQNPKTLTSWP